MEQNSIWVLILCFITIGGLVVLYKDQLLQDKKAQALYNKGFDWAAGMLVRRDMTVAQVRATVPTSTTDPYLCGVRDAAHKLRNSTLVRR